MTPAASPHLPIPGMLLRTWRRADHAQSTSKICFVPSSADLLHCSYQFSVLGSNLVALLICTSLLTWIPGCWLPGLNFTQVPTYRSLPSLDLWLPCSDLEPPLCSLVWSGDPGVHLATALSLLVLSCGASCPLGGMKLLAWLLPLESVLLKEFVPP